MFFGKFAPLKNKAKNKPIKIVTKLVQYKDCQKSNGPFLLVNGDRF
jgi:hypothetical protein